MTGAARDPDGFSVIRPPKALLIYVAVFLVIWCGGVLTAAITMAREGTPAAILPVIMLAFGLTIGIGMFRLSVTCEAEALTVRNVFRTKRLSREEIEGFRSGPMTNQPFGWTIYALLADGSVLPLDVAGRPYRFGIGRTKLEQRQAMLQSWLEHR